MFGIHYNEQFSKLVLPITKYYIMPSQFKAKMVLSKPGGHPLNRNKCCAPYSITLPEIVNKVEA